VAIGEVRREIDAPAINCQGCLVNWAFVRVIVHGSGPS
jgi:hypothetical protein